MAPRRPRYLLVDVRSRARTYLWATHDAESLQSLPEELPRRRATRHRKALYTEAPIRFVDLLKAGTQRSFAVHELRSAFVTTSTTPVANYLLVTADSGSNAVMLFASDASSTKATILALTVVDGTKHLPFPALEYRLMSGKTKPLPRSPGGEAISCDFYERRTLL